MMCEQAGTGKIMFVLKDCFSDLQNMPNLHESLKKPVVIYDQLKSHNFVSTKAHSFLKQCFA